MSIERRRDFETSPTDYLFSTEANKARLLKAIENADKGEHLTEINLADFKKELGIH